MARYIDADKLSKGLEEMASVLAPFKQSTILGVVETIKNMPTADVVPKSEYDAVVSAVDNSTKEFLKLHDAYQEQKVEFEAMRMAANSYKMHYENLAREIFEEIENVAKIYTFPITRMGVIEIVKEPFWCIEPNDFAELKKKYTEGV